MAEWGLAKKVIKSPHHILWIIFHQKSRETDLLFSETKSYSELSEHDKDLMLSADHMTNMFKPAYATPPGLRCWFSP